MNKWYLLEQNNSYGEWFGPNNVLVQAESEDEAWAIAIRDTEVYLDEGQDCVCCGSRWGWVDEFAQPFAPLAAVVAWAEGVIGQDYRKGVAIYCSDGSVHRFGPQHD